jgi:nitrate reductase NapAB chaperone NapD
MNISSVVVKTTAEKLHEVIESINKIPDCETHFFDLSGKVVVTIEGQSINAQTALMKKIQDIPFVYGVNLAYTYCEDELSESIKNIKNQSLI